jgi:exodeoxyribonuclease V gamma subunit
MLIVHQSNRQERLADALTEVLETRLPSPLTPDIVAVQSGGAARWLALRLARRFGIAANLHFPFPATLLWRLFRALLPGVPERSPFAAEVLTWRIMRHLAEVLDWPGFESLADYIRGGDDLPRYQLAERIALLFDEYLVYRPDWILAWEQGKADHWQARLWRRMTDGREIRHRVRLATEFIETLRRGGPGVAGLPPRISLFGLTSLPPGHLQLFAAIAEVVDVHLFLLNPCREYWGTIRDDREIARRAVREEPAHLYLESGNSLLASLGKQGRDLLDALQDLESLDDARFEDPGDGSLLCAIQSDLLNLRNRGEGDHRPTEVRGDDRSIQVHSCHSAVREVEVLHDQLLAILEAEPALTPADVVVMTPDIDAYAPTIEAVFGTADPARRIPYHVAGRAARAASPLIRAFFDLLEIAESRLDANSVLAILEVEAVRRRFGLSESDLDLIRDWLRATGVRWGVDAEDRAARGLPRVSDHTWRAGLDRLLLGYALPGGGTRLFAGVLPYDEIEGDAAATAGRLVTFADALFRTAADLQAPRSAAAWPDRLRALAGDFLDPEEAEEGARGSVLAAITAMEAHARQAEFAGDLSLRVVRLCLQGLVEADGGRAPLAAGSVTFSGMVPVRGIPFAVVCLIGMNDGAFPRVQPSPSFDLMREAPRAGDRSRRQDDRSLFLEALLAARRVLYLSYVGQHIRENSPLPPSVLVSELVDYIERGFVGPDPSQSIRERLVTKHPLQAFSPRYFRGDDPVCVSYAADLCEASRVAAGARTGRPPFLETRLPEPTAEWREVQIEEFVGFFSHPTRYLVRERLGIRLEEDEGLLDVREPFALDPLSGYQLRQGMLDGRLRGTSLDEVCAAARAGGLLPHGAVGDAILQREAARVEAFARRVVVRRPAMGREAVSVDLDLGPIRLRGRLADLGPQGRFSYRFAAPRVKDRIALWINHLLMNRLAPPDVAPESLWLGDDGEIRLASVAGAEGHLRRLAEIYWAGVSRTLPLFPESSYAYAQKRHQNDEHEAALAEARRVWDENEFTGRGEETDPYHRLAFRDVDPLGEEFAALTEDVFLPLLAHQEESS